LRSQHDSQAIKSQVLSTVKVISDNNSKSQTTNEKKKKSSVFFLIKVILILNSKALGKRKKDNRG
jgi:hypothetical protein